MIAAIAATYSKLLSFEGIVLLNKNQMIHVVAEGMRINFEDVHCSWLNEFSRRRDDNVQF